jgi:acyl-CoA thioesterase-1
MKRVEWRWGVLIASVTLVCACPARAEPIQIVALGASLTYGKGVSPNESYPAQLEAALKAKGYDVAVKNAGINGDTAVGGLARLDSDVPPGTQIAIIALGMNDRQAGASKAEIGASLEQIVSRLRARGVEVLLQQDPKSKALKSFVDAQGAVIFPFSYQEIPNGDKIDQEGHLNPAGYAIQVQKMLPLVEALIGRVQHAKN